MNLKGPYSRAFIFENTFMWWPSSGLVVLKTECFSFLSPSSYLSLQDLSLIYQKTQREVIMKTKREAFFRSSERILKNVEKDCSYKLTNNIKKPAYLPYLNSWVKMLPALPNFLNLSTPSFTFSNVTWTQHDWCFQETWIHVERLLMWLQLHLLRCCNTMLGRGNQAVSYHHIQYSIPCVHVFSVNKSV